MGNGWGATQVFCLPSFLRQRLGFPLAVYPKEKVGPTCHPISATWHTNGCRDSGFEDLIRGRYSHPGSFKRRGCWFYMRSKKHLRFATTHQTRQTPFHHLIKTDPFSDRMAVSPRYGVVIRWWHPAFMLIQKGESSMKKRVQSRHDDRRSSVGPPVLINL